MDSNLHRVIIVFCIAAVMLSLYGMHVISITTDTSGGVAKFLAKAEIVNNEVKRKPTGSISWYTVAGGGLFGFRDTVFVGPGGFVTLAFNDGTKLTINENSLVVLDMEKHQSKGPTSEVTEIRLVRGDVAVEKAEGGGDLDIIVGKDSKIGVQSGSTIALAKNSEKLDLVVRRGKVKLAKGNAQNRKVYDVEVARPSYIKDLDLRSGDSEISNKLNERQTMSEAEEASVQTLLKKVSESKSQFSSVQSIGKVTSFSKEVNLKGARVVAAIPRSGTIPRPEIVKPEELAKPTEPVKPPEPTKFIDISKRNSKLIVELQPEALKDQLPLSIELSFQKDHDQQFLSLPIIIPPSSIASETDDSNKSQTYVIDVQYLLEVPGFKKMASKFSNIYWRLKNSEGKIYQTKWVGLKSPRSTSLIIKSKSVLVIDAEEDEVSLPLTWKFKGVFVDRFKISVLGNAPGKNQPNTAQPLCEFSIPNQNFVDPLINDSNHSELKTFKYTIKSSSQCKLNDFAKGDSKLFVRVEPIEADGNTVTANASGKFISEIVRPKTVVAPKRIPARLPNSPKGR